MRIFSTSILLACSLTISPPVSAADFVNAWINIATVPALAIADVREQSDGGATRQVIIARVDADPVTFDILKSRCSDVEPCTAPSILKAAEDLRVARGGDRLERVETLLRVGGVFDDPDGCRIWHMGIDGAPDGFYPTVVTVTACGATGTIVAEYMQRIEVSDQGAAAVVASADPSASRTAQPQERTRTPVAVADLVRQGGQASIYDSWIDIFTIPGFRATKFEYRLGGTQQSFTGGVSRGQFFLFKVARNPCGDKPCSKREIRSFTRNPKSLSRLFGNDDGHSRRTVEGQGRYGASIIFRKDDCLGSMVGLRKRSDGKYPIVVTAIGCGDTGRALLADYLPRMDLSTPERNRADERVY